MVLKARAVTQEKIYHVKNERDAIKIYISQMMREKTIESDGAGTQK